MQTTQSNWADRAKELDNQAALVKKGEVYHGKITDIIEDIAGRVFCGKDGKKPVKNPDRAVITLAIEIDDGEKFSETFSLPDSPRAWYNDKFKLGLYKKRYGAMPMVGDKVNVIIDGDGFYRIML